MTRKAQRRAGAIVSATMLIAVAALAGIGYSAWRYPRRAREEGDKRAVRVTVSRGMTAAAIGRTLVEHGLIDHPSWFRIYATERGDSQKVKPGQYRFSPSMTPAQILDALVEGVPEEEVAVTLPEGKNLLEVAQLLDEQGVTPKDELLRAARDEELLRQLGIAGDSAEGYLYPDRYKFHRGTPAAKVVSRLVAREREVYAELAEQHKAQLAALDRQYHFGESEVVLMASLVEKETAATAERPLIAGVFLNRLRLASFKPHLLQTDPTIVYGCTVPTEKSEACKKFEGRIRRMHLEDRDNPYNTYTHEGLPPGPICNPGRAALEAVMDPSTTPYLFFVSKNDGTHQFSRTRAEHEAAVDRYQRHGGT